MPIIKIFLFLPLFSRISFFNLKNVEFYSIFKFGKSLNRWWIEQRMHNNSLLNSSQVKKKRKSSKKMKKWKKQKIHALNNGNSYEIGTYLCVCVYACVSVCVWFFQQTNDHRLISFPFFFGSINPFIGPSSIIESSPSPSSSFAFLFFSFVL